MKPFEWKVINGYYVRKEGHASIRTRSGWAKSWYYIYESMEDMWKGINRIGSAETMKDIRELLKGDYNGKN